jgi:Skp family chaperone for outer membrane proteins
MKKTGIVLAALFTLTLSSGGNCIEISLTQNRGELGSIGYVDIERVFNSLPETKEDRESLNLEIINNQDRLKEKEKLVAELGKDLKLLKEQLKLLTPEEVSDKGENDESKLTPEDKSVKELEERSREDLKKAIAKKEQELKNRKAEMEQFRSRIEQTLLEKEDQKIEVIMGRIYRALRELANEERVSVVIDKKNILYGQKVVDLTDKLLRKLDIKPFFNGKNNPFGRKL